MAAMTVGALHTLAPDHFVPVAAVARARGWSRGRTARVALLCGFGHVTVWVLLGGLALLFGLQLLASVGQQMEAVAGLFADRVRRSVTRSGVFGTASPRACTATRTAIMIMCMTPPRPR